MADIDGGRKDWSELNPDLLQLIGEALTDISDCFNFRAVCKSWRFSGEYLLPPRRGPWLLLLPRMDSTSHNDDCHVISPFDNWRRFTLRTPYSLRMKSSFVFGSPYSYFLVIDETTGSVSVTNPLIPGEWLTPLPCPLPEEAVSEFEDGIVVNMAKIVRSIDYNNDPKNNVIVSVSDIGFPFLWRAGDSTWTQMTVNFIYVYDFALYKGSFYLVDSDKTVVLDFVSLDQTSEIAHPKIDTKSDDVRFFLVESSSGELLMVAWNLYYTVWVFQLDSSKQQPKWVRVKNIGEDTLFLSDGGVMCFPTGRISGFANNCVYFISFFGNRSEVIIWDIEDDTVEFLPYDTGNQRAVWIIPSYS